MMPSGPATDDRAIACSVVVLTLNEARNLPACLSSVRGFDDVHVLDSGSTDGTRDIARAFGAQVAEHPFHSFGQQRNVAHDHLPLRHDWVLHLDADERLTPALRQEIAEAVQGDDGRLAGYYLAERTLLHGRWLRHAAQYPRYQARLVHRGRMRFIDHGHGQRESAERPLGTLRHPYDHEAFSQGLEHWLRKHAGYAMREAEVATEGDGGLAASLAAWRGGSAIERRRALKALALRLPFRPTLRWLYIMVARRGVLDGAAGWQYAEMMRTFQSMTDLCIAERRLRAEPAERRAAGTAGGSTRVP